MADNNKNSLVSALFAGGAAGFGVDVSLYPLDTLKTRLQSAEGFRKSGGFTGVYNGLGPAALGSAPTAALFFLTYEFTKKQLPQGSPFLANCTAAGLGEVVACLIRVPIENVKQKMQAGHYSTMRAAISGIKSADGSMGFFKGYVTTVFRDIPFAFIQYPLWEALKKEWAVLQHRETTPFQGALCGAVAGAAAASLTTPLDVAKTRLMLGKDVHGVAYTTMTGTLARVYSTEGVSGLFKGLGPRCTFIGLGGLVFFYVYESAYLQFSRLLGDAPRR